MLSPMRRLPDDLVSRTPLLTEKGLQNLRRLQEHDDAPRWNHVAGDRLVRADLKALDAFAAKLASRKPMAPPLKWAKSLRVPRYRAYDSVDWASIPTTSREDIAVRPEQLVPDDADLSRMIVYRTAGTTGHALLVPHDPRATACYQPLVEFALRRHGVKTKFGPTMTACFLVGAQARTVTYPTVLSAWDGAGFAKLNLNPADWPRAESAQRYFDDLAPAILTGDPISFAEMLRMGINHRPAAMVTTAVGMSGGLKRRLEKAYRCPVIDWYSLTETGPLGYACPKGGGFHVLPHDVYVEALDEDGNVTSGRGEITVSGGRNPFIPLLRYRTGDWGRIESAPCSCGDKMARIVELEGRAPVLYRAANGAVVNPVDISRALREFPLVQHEFVQRADRSCELTVRALDEVDGGAIVAALRTLLGAVRVDVRPDARLGDRKVIPYRSELPLEE